MTSPRKVAPATREVREHPPYEPLIAYCEQCLDLYGDNYRGVGWTLSEEATDRRYRVMAELIEPDGEAEISVLDVGCGAGHFYEYLRRGTLGEGVRYSGLDLSPKFLALCRRKFPDLAFYDVDLLEGLDGLPRFDYLIMNGLFTFKAGLDFDVMFDYCRRLVASGAELAGRGLAFNVQSPLAEPRDYLFHLPFDRVPDLVPEGSRGFTIRHDYGLLDYTIYVHR